MTGTHIYGAAAGQSADSTQERERRQRVLKKAIVSYADRAITVECMARDLSSNGVKLQSMQPLPIPDNFHLEIPMDGISVDCQVRWRNGTTLGAAFISPIQIEERVRQKVNPTGLGVLRKPTLQRQTP